MNQKPKLDYKRLIIGTITIAVIVVILSIPIIPVVVTYSETEPWSRLAKYEVVSTTLTEEFELFGRGVYHKSTVVVKNIDSYGGTFTVKYYLPLKHCLYDVLTLFEAESISRYIGAGNTETFIAEFDIAVDQDVGAEYSISAPTVIDQIVVTKHKTVYNSIIELLIYG